MNQIRKHTRVILFIQLEKITELCQHVRTRIFNSTMVKSEQSIRWKMLDKAIQEELTRTLEYVSQHFLIIENKFETILNAVQLEETTIKLQRTLIDRIKKYIKDAKELRITADRLIDSIPDENFVVTYSQITSNWTIQRIPFHIRDEYVDRIAKMYETTLFTSATLYVDETTELFTLELLDTLHNDHELTASIKISSPFNYAKQVNGAIASFLSEYIYDDKIVIEQWKHEISKMIALQSISLDGRSLVLFHSWDVMIDIYKRIHHIFQEFDIPLLLQEKVGSSEALIQEFQGLEESVLFGTGRFWNGVDFPGPTLSQLIIVRLPNAPLSDPLLEERKERWGKDLFLIFGIVRIPNVNFIKDSGTSYVRVQIKDYSSYLTVE